MAKATKANSKKTTKPAPPPLLSPYWAHVVASLFGVVIVLYGTSMVSDDIQHAASMPGFDTSLWGWGVGVVAFGGMLVGAALSKAGYIYHSTKDKK